MYDSLVEGKTYKVRLKPFDELLELGLVGEGSEAYTWYKNYLGCDVGLVKIPSQEECRGVRVYWSTGKSFLYDLRELKVLGEV